MTDQPRLMPLFTLVIERREGDQDGARMVTQVRAPDEDAAVAKHNAQNPGWRVTSVTADEALP